MRYLRLTLLLLLLAPASLAAQGGGTKIGIFNFDRAVGESMEGQAAARNLQGKADAYTRELEEMQANYVSAQEEYALQQNALSTSARAQKERELNAMGQAITRRQEDASAEMEYEQALVLGPIYDKANQVMQAYAAEQGYAVILDVSAQNSSVVYFSDVFDVTTEIIRRMNETYEEPAAAESATEPEVSLPLPDAESPQP